LLSCLANRSLTGHHLRVLPNPNVLAAISKSMQAVKLLQKPLTVLNWGRQLTWNVLNNGHKTVEIVVVVILELVFMAERGPKPIIRCTKWGRSTNQQHPQSEI